MEDISGTGGNAGAGATGAVSGGASPASHTESPAGSASSAEPSTQPTGSTDSTDREGFIPRARFDEVNTRMAAAEKFREQYRWAESVPREQLEEMSGWYAKYKGDPGDFLEQAYQEALSHPVHGATVKSRIGRMLASMRAQQAQQAQPEPTFEPDVPVMNEQGQIVSRTYSADLVKQMLAHEIDKRIQPLKQDYDTRQETAKQAKEREEQQAQAYSIADADVAYVTKRPFFKEHKAEILETFKANPTMSLREAADYVLDTKVLPGYGQKAEAKVLSDLQQKANAQTVNPGTPSGSGKPKFKTFSDAYAYYEQHPEEREAMANR